MYSNHPGSYVTPIGETGIADFATYTNETIGV
jgi:hypothetical protein